MDAEVKLFKSKAVSSKAHRNTETVILWGFKFLALPVSDFRNARTFCQDLFAQLNRVCTFVPVHGLLEYPKKLDSSIFWAGYGRFCGDFPSFCVLAPRDQTC